MLGFIVFARNNKHENIKGAIYLLSKFMILFKGSGVRRFKTF